MQSLPGAILISLLTISPAVLALDFSNGRWIDLTHEFSSETIYWPTGEPFKHETVFEGLTKKGFYYTAYNICAAEHGGTHIDAPVHFAEGRQTVEQVPIEQLIGSAVIIDLTEKTLKNRDYQVSVGDFLVWERKHNTKIDRNIVLLHTGFSRYWPDRVKYMGTNKQGDVGVSELHFPGLHPNAAKWLVSNRSIKAIGLDTPSIDFGQSKFFESHQILFKKKYPSFREHHESRQTPSNWCRSHCIAYENQRR